MTNPTTDSVEHAIVKSLARPPASWAHLVVDPSTRVRIGDESIARKVDAELMTLPPDECREIRIALPDPLVEREMELRGYPSFGLYVLRSASVYLAIRCGSRGQEGRGGHDHNDQLAIELNVDGADWIRDPGTYIYTALPAMRNAYRSVRVHFAPQLEGEEPASLDEDVFALGPGTSAECMYWGPGGFAGCHTAADSRVALCRIKFDGAILRVTHAAIGAKLLSPRAEPDDWRALLPDIAYSPGYGIVER